MYGSSSSSMNSNVQRMLHQGTSSAAYIDEEDEDDVVFISTKDEDDDIDNFSSQIRYETPGDSHGLGVMDDFAPNAIYGSDVASPVAGECVADQLTLAFRGQVHVFDGVSPEKVQEVLLLLGGYELPTGIPIRGTTPENHRDLGDYPGRSSHPQRAASLKRFREKREGRCFDKKIRYNVRKEVALRMQRKKGQFMSSKSVPDEPGLSSADMNGSSVQEEQETSCRHCGISSKSTPMMRRGPDGPRTLCNACGLKWANKGVLRELTKTPTIGMQHHDMQATEILNGQAHGQSIITPSANVTISSNGDC